MEVAIVVGIYLTLAVQAWRNHLMMKAMNQNNCNCKCECKHENEKGSIS